MLEPHPPTQRPALRRCPTPTGCSRRAARRRAPRGPRAGGDAQRLKQPARRRHRLLLDLTLPGELEPYDHGAAHRASSTCASRSATTACRRGASTWCEILDCLHDALRSGRPAYVHCRAGIGRTGHRGRVPARRAWPVGEQALDELNRLWQQCERSKIWPTFRRPMSRTTTSGTGARRRLASRR